MVGLHWKAFTLVIGDVFKMYNGTLQFKLSFSVVILNGGLLTGSVALLKHLLTGSGPNYNNSYLHVNIKCLCLPSSVRLMQEISPQSIKRINRLSTAHAHLVRQSNFMFY